ncbi:MAG: 50S ribosomal protein L23 [Halobacteriales archaeon]
MSEVIVHPLVTEKAMNLMDFQNKLQFIVHDEATKPDIAAAIEDRFDVEVTDVTTQFTMDGEKKATVTLGPADDAGEIASRIGVF